MLVDLKVFISPSGANGEAKSFQIMGSCPNNLLEESTVSDVFRRFVEIVIHQDNTSEKGISIGLSVHVMKGSMV